MQDRLRIAKDTASASLDRLERLLMHFTRAMLDGHATFEDGKLAFILNSIPPAVTDLPREQGEDQAGGSSLESNAIPLGRYEFPRRSEEAHVYRLQHPLAQSLLRVAQRTSLSPAKLHLNYEAYGQKVSVVEPLRGSEGIAVVQLLRVQSLGAIEEYLLAAGSYGDQLMDAEVTEKLLTLPGQAEELPRVNEQDAASDPTQPDQSFLDFTAAHVVVPTFVRQELDRQNSKVIGEIEGRNLKFFAEESEKLDAWSDDLKVALEREIKELDRRIKESRTKSKGAATLAEKLAAQKEQREFEGQRDKKRRELFVRQDEIQAQRDQLIEDLEQQLGQQVTQTAILVCEWRMP